MRAIKWWINAVGLGCICAGLLGIILDYDQHLNDPDLTYIVMLCVMFGGGWLAIALVDAPSD